MTISRDLGVVFIKKPANRARIAPIVPKMGINGGLQCLAAEHPNCTICIS